MAQRDEGSDHQQMEAESEIHPLDLNLLKLIAQEVFDDFAAKEDSDAYSREWLKSRVLEPLLRTCDRLSAQIQSARIPVSQTDLWLLFISGLHLGSFARPSPERLEMIEENVREKGRRRGGNSTGAAQTRAAEAVWKPWVDKYNQKIAAGLSAAKARRSVKAEMAKAEFQVERRDGTKGFPEDRTILKWLPAKKTERS